MCVSAELTGTPFSEKGAGQGTASPRSGPSGCHPQAPGPHRACPSVCQEGGGLTSPTQLAALRAPVSKLPEGGRLCAHRGRTTPTRSLQEKRLGEKSTEVFFSFFFFSILPEGSAASWARNKHQPAVENAGPRCPEGAATVRFPLPLHAPDSWARDGDAKVSRLPPTWDREANSTAVGSWVKELHSQPDLPPSFQIDCETVQSQLDAGCLARGRGACFCCSCMYFLPLLGQPSVTRTPLYQAPLTLPPLGHFPCVFIPQIFREHCWVPGSKSHPFAGFHLAQILTLKLSVRAGSGSCLAEHGHSSQALGSPPLLQGG